METNGGTHFSTGNNKEAYGGNSDENEKGGKEEVKEETGGISPEGGKIQTGASPKEEGNQEVGASPKEEGKEEVKEEMVVSPARWWVLTILFSHLLLIHTRWVLAIFSLLGMVQCMLWNTWGPVKTLLF